MQVITDTQDALLLTLHIVWLHTKAVSDATEWKLLCCVRVGKRMRGGGKVCCFQLALHLCEIKWRGILMTVAALRNSERQFSGINAQKDRQKHCKMPRSWCWFDGSQPPRWQWKFDGQNNTRNNAA